MKVWKDTKGNKLTAKEFAKRFKEGIDNITPLQRIANEMRSTFTMLIGYVIGLVSLIIFRESFIVQWFTYALIIIFVGSTWGQGIKFLALRSQYKLFKNLGNQSLDLDSILSGLEAEPESNLAKEKIELQGGKENETTRKK